VAACRTTEGQDEAIEEDPLAGNWRDWFSRIKRAAAWLVKAASGVRGMTAAPRELLDGFGVKRAPSELVLGTFDKGLTVFDQQVRALNLAYRLGSGKTFPAAQPIAVIGGGVAGLTFAAGCIWLGQGIVLIERQPVPCHLQRGCDIRWVHPHIYHWPKGGSEQPYAGLPLLSWEEGTASEVARQITLQWERLAEAASKLGLLRELYSAQYGFQAADKKKVEVRGVEDGKQVQVTIEPAYIVYAVGFGVEEGHPKLKPHSYWENDSLNQLMPNHPQGEKVRWMVSGTGDGGLIDLQRLCIESFRQGRVVEELFAEERTLVRELVQIAENASKKNEPIWPALDALDRAGRFKQVDERLRRRKRDDAAVVLNYRTASFPDAFARSKASFLNKLITHRLYAIAAFEYIGGEIWNIDRYRTCGERCYRTTMANPAAKTAVFREFDRIVVRYGTTRRLWLEQAGYGCCGDLEEQVIAQTGHAVPEWDPGWWSLKAKSELLKEVRAAAGGAVGKIDPSPREHVSPITEAVATTFVKTTAGLLGRRAAAGKSYRLTLHRVVPMNGRLRVQQIAEYAGTRPDDTPVSAPGSEYEGSALHAGTVGRVFDVNHLTIGLCVRSRAPHLLRSKVTGMGPKNEKGEAQPLPADDLKKDMEKLFLDKSYARHMVSSVRAVLTIPLFTANIVIDKAPCVSLVLYADSDDNTFFSKEVINDLHAACTAFRDHVDAFAEQRESSYRIVEWDWSDVHPGDIVPAEKSLRELTTLTLDPKDYGSLANDRGEWHIETIKFKQIDVMDIVPRLS
jgi:hypothetical protein